MTSSERFYRECVTDIREMKAGRVPTSWEVGQDQEAMQLVRRLLTRPTKDDVSEAFRASAFNAWSEQCGEGLVPFIDRMLSEVPTLLAQ
jgi:hypothetical protein